MIEKNINLEKDFPYPSYDDWKKTAEKDLKGELFEKKLITKTYEGINLQPLYTQKDLEETGFERNLPGFEYFIRNTKSSGYLSDGWEICQSIPYILPIQVNEALKHDIKRGLNSINFCPDLMTKKGIDISRGYNEDFGKGGTNICDYKDFSECLEGIDIEKFPINIDSGYDGIIWLSLLELLVKQRKANKNKIRGSLNIDPYAFFVENGYLPSEKEKVFDNLSYVINRTSKNLANVKTIGVNTLPYHNAGCNAIQELAFGIATAIDYIRELQKREIGINTAANNFRFTFGIGSFFFMEIAKLRAARLLWSKILEKFGCGKEESKMFIHCRTSFYNQTEYDVYVNMLRSVTECFSAVAGSADSIETNTYDEVLGLPDDFSRRIARNTQIILSEESNLNKLIDPSAGSYFIEKLTYEVAKESYNLFRQIEERGGMYNSLKEGFPQSETEKINMERMKDVEKRKSIIVGTNMYANPKEVKHEIKLQDYKRIYDKCIKHKIKKYDSLKNLPAEYKLTDKLIQETSTALSDGVFLSEINERLYKDTKHTGNIKTLTPVRLSSKFEELRRLSEDYTSKKGHKPRVFLLTFGSLSQHKARADFSRSFFETGGFEVIYEKGFDTPEDAFQSLLETGPVAAVICSTDETYKELVPSAGKLLKEKTKNIKLILAGNPKDQENYYRENGVDYFIFMGANAYNILKDILMKA